MNKNLVEFDDLLKSPFYFGLNKEYRNHLIQKAIQLKGNLESVAKEVGCHKDTLKNFKNYDQVSIGAIYLRNILHLLDIPLVEAQKYVLSARRGCSNREVKIQFPIRATPDLALLIAKTCGDGCVLSDWRFHYTNNQMNLIEEVISAVRNSIGESKHTLHKRVRIGTTFEIKFSPVVGYILHSLGSPKGYKINQGFPVPEWIMHGSLEVKSAFLKGLFDDESTVTYPSKRISLSLGKKKGLKEDLEYFLQQVRMLLFDFGIQSNRLRVQTTYQDKLMMELTVYKKQNFKFFQEHIGFTHQKKKRILDEMIHSYTDQHVTRDSILQLVHNSTVSRTTKEIATLKEISEDVADVHLRNLYKNGLIRKIEGYRNKWVP